MANWRTAAKIFKSIFKILGDSPRCFFYYETLQKRKNGCAKSKGQQENQRTRRGNYSSTDLLKQAKKDIKKYGAAILSTGTYRYRTLI